MKGGCDAGRPSLPASQSKALNIVERQIPGMYRQVTVHRGPWSPKIGVNDSMELV